MFLEEEDWNDEPDAQILSKKLLQNARNTKKSEYQKVKPVGKKSLMRTLKTLGSVPEWKNEDQQCDSDSDPDTGASLGKKKRKKKKRSKRGKHTEDAEEQESEVVEVEECKEKTQTKKRKKETPVPKKAKPTSDQVEKSGPPKSEEAEEQMHKMNRKQWKNKMKRNKRKCKNKFRPNGPDENNSESADKQNQKVEIPKDCNKKAVESKQMKPRPQKRKNAEAEADVKKKIKVGVGLINGSKQEAVNDTKKLILSPKPTPSKEQIRKKDQLRKLMQRQERVKEQPVEEEELEEKPEEKPEVKPEEMAEEKPEEMPDASARLRSRMEQRLESARFRYINEVLYSTSSGEARRMFQQDPEAFWVYHRGYTTQVQKWPVNPVDSIIAYIQKKPASLVVADFGCGDCKIARSVKNKVHCFDLVSTCKLVTVCDMAKVPLKDRSVDIAVFCLSLMGTNLVDFLTEANRVLKMGGVLKVAEVASRFENTRNFLSALGNLGFTISSKEIKDSHFHCFEFSKTSEAPTKAKNFGLQLKACVYKKR